MPRNQFERMMFALMTVIVTVHAYVFYSLYVVNGSTLMSVTGENSVLGAVNAMGGVYMFGRNLPIWAVVITEFILAYTLEITVGSPMSFKLACKVFDPKETHPVLFESAIICATIGIMCPAMSFLAAFLYYIPFYLIPILFVICRLTYLILSAIIIEVNIAKHRNDTKMDIRKITPLLIGFEEVLKCA